MPGIIGGMYQGPQNWSDRLAIIGAALKDASPNSQGGNLSQAQQMLMQRQMAQAQMGMMGKLNGLFGGQAQYQDGPAPSVSAPSMLGASSAAPGGAPEGLSDPSAAIARGASSMAHGPAPASPAPYSYRPPTRIAGSGPASLSDPATQQTILQAAMFGVPGAKEALDILDKSRPTVKIGPDGTPYDERDVGALMKHFANRQVANDQVIDLNDSTNNNRGLVSAPVKGAAPQYDNLGHVIGWGLPKSSAQAIGAAKAAEIGAQQAAEMPYVGPRAYATAAGAKAGELPFAGPIAQATASGESAGKGPYEMITVDVNGAPTTMSKAQFAAMQGVGGAPPAAKAFGSAQAASVLSRLLPGAIPTSGARSPAHNAAVGGVPDSLHLADGAIDFVPPKGADFNAFKAKLAQSGLPVSELIKDGSHWHWGFAPKGAAPAPSAPTAGGITGVNPADKKTVEEYQAAAHAAEQVAALGDQFIDLNKKSATGPLYKPFDVALPLIHHEIDVNVPGRLMRDYGKAVPAMDNLTTQMGLSMRGTNMRTTQMEFQKFLGSSMNKDNTGPQNEGLKAQYHSGAEARRAYANFASDWLTQHGSLNGMDQSWNAQNRTGPAASSAGPGNKPRMKWNPQTGALQ